MNKPENDKDLTDRESRLMESLLERAANPPVERDAARIDKLMSAIQAEPDAHAVAPRKVTTGSKRFLRWLPLPVAAGILVAVLFLTQPGGSENAAMAALDRTIAAEEKPNAREYTVTITRDASGSTRTSEHQLFVRRRDFAISRKRLIGTGKVWMGGRGDQRWIVPGFGPVLVGGKDLLNKAVPKTQVLQTPFMSVSRILERTKRFYELTMQSDVQLKQAERTINCQYIVGTRIQSPRFVIPEQVEIWANPETGFAQRVRLVWDKNDKSRWLEATADLVGTPTLPDDFFDHTAHHEPDRNVIIRN